MLQPPFPPVSPYLPSALSLPTSGIPVPPHIASVSPCTSASCPRPCALPSPSALKSVPVSSPALTLPQSPSSGDPNLIPPPAPPIRQSDRAIGDWPPPPSCQSRLRATPQTCPGGGHTPAQCGGRSDSDRLAGKGGGSKGRGRCRDRDRDQEPDQEQDQDQDRD